MSAAGEGRVLERRQRLGGVETLVRERSGEGVPTVFVHGNPTHSADWIPFLERIGGPALAFDLPNFGRAERLAPGRFDATMHAYGDWIGAAIDELAPDRFNLVVHDWGGIALHPAQRRARRLGRVVVIDAVPLLGGYEWHWIARIWRRRGLGELLNATASRSALALLLRQARPGGRPMPERFVEMIWSCWDREMSRAVLDLYRSADPGALEAAGAHLDRISCPVLICWGRDDPYVGSEQAGRYASRFAASEVSLYERAGHWPWIDRPEIVGEVCDFLTGRGGRSRSSADR